MGTGSYFDKALTHTNGELVGTMREHLHGTDYDTIVGTGLSGTIFTARVAPGLRKKFAIVRKKDDHSTHSGTRIEGQVGTRYVVADDFVSSGATLKHVLNMMHEVHPKAQFVGVYQYEYARFKDAETCVEDYGQWVAEIALGGPLFGPQTYQELARSTFGPVVRKAPAGGWHPSVAHLVPLPHLRLTVLDYQDREGPTFWNSETGIRIRSTDKRVAEMVDLLNRTLVKDGTYNRYVGLQMDTVMRTLNGVKPKPKPPVATQLKLAPVQKLIEFNEAMCKADQEAFRLTEAAKPWTSAGFLDQ